MENSGSVLSQLQHQIGELHTDAIINGQNSYHRDSEDDSYIVSSVVETVISPVAEPTPEVSKIDLDSEELFPALPAAQSGKALPAWRAPPIVATAPKLNGTAPVKKSGKVTERLEIPVSLQAKLPANGKGSAWDIAKVISLRTQTNVEFSTHRTTQAMTFLITGKPDAVKQCRREIVAAVGIQVTETLHVPASVRPHLLGAGGKNLKALTAETSTRISIPRAQTQDHSNAAEGTLEALDDDDNQVVTIVGDYEGVKIAKERIESEVAKRTSKLNLRVHIERSFHPFIAGPNNSSVQAVETATGTRIHIPPFAPGAVDKNLDEIIVIGDRESVKLADERLKAIYENLKRTTTTVQLPVKKRQHRFIIGPKGATLQEILHTTGCFVELPPSTDPSDVVTVRGPTSKLGEALQAVLQKANETLLEEIDVASLLPKATDPRMFLRYLFTKERAELRKVEAAYSVTISQQQTSAGQLVIEIQGKSRQSVDDARIETQTIVSEWGSSLFFGEVEIPRGLHRFVVGKGGQNIIKMKSSPTWEGRLVDIVVPNEADESDEVLLVVRRMPAGLAGAPNAKAPKGGRAEAAAAASDAEVQLFVEKVRAETLAVATAQADFVTEIVPVPSKYHGRLIGAGGEKLKELLSPYGLDVSVKFPSLSTAGKAKDGEDSSAKKAKDVDPNAVTIKGPKKEVGELKDKILKLVADLKHIEVISSFSETINVGKGLARKVLSGVGAAGPSGSGDRERSSGSSIGWLIRLVREAFAAAPSATGKAGAAADLTPEQAILNLRVEVNDTDDKLTIFGPKSAVAHAKAILSDRSARLVDQTSIEVRLFEEVSKEAQQVLKETEIPDLKRRILRRLIGKEGKGVKNTMEKHAVYIQFPRRGKKGKKGEDDDDDEGIADEGNDDNGSTDGLVIIKGNKKDVVSAKVELLDTVEKEIVRSFVLTFQIPKSVLPHVVGSQGSRVNKIKDECGIRIDLNDVEDDPSKIEVVLEGSRKGCFEAQKKINDAVDDLVNVGTVELRVPSYLHKDIIGSAGSRIKKVIESFGGQDKVKVQFPPRGDSSVGGPSSNIITLKAHTRDLQALRQAVENLISDALTGESIDVPRRTLLDETSDVVSETINVSKGEISRILGRGGDTLKDLIKKFDVNVWLEEVEGSDSGECSVTVVGKTTELVKDAIQDIKGRQRAVHTVAIPEKVLENLANLATHEAELASLNDILRKIRSDTSGSASAEMSNTASRGTPGSVVTIRGDAKYIPNAVSILEKGFKELMLYESTIRIAIDQDVRPHIIGRAGATISRIRAETGANIDISRPSDSRGSRQAPSSKPDIVVIRGSADAVGNARAIIERIVEDQKVRQAREKERDAVRAAASAAPARTSSVAPTNVAPARIDDDIFSDAGSSVAESGVPGFSGRAPGTTGRRGKTAPISSSLVTGVPTASTSYYAFNPVREDDGWQDVKKKGKKGDDDGVSVTENGATNVPGAGESARSKNKKKKSKSKQTSSVVDTPGNDAEEEEKEEEEKAADSIPATIASIKVNGDAVAASSTIASAAADIQPELSKSQKKKARLAAAATASSTNGLASSMASPAASVPEAPAGAVQKPVPTASIAHEAISPPVVGSSEVFLDEFEEVPADDGWTTVSTVKKFKQNKLESAATPSATAEAAPLAGAEAPKKKKNKKKKKKAAAGAESAVTDVGEDEDDEE